jgi:hypothetical protein
MRAVAVSVTSVSFYVGWVFPIGVAMLLALYSPGVSQFPSLTNQYTDFPQINWYRISSRQVRRLMAILPGPVNALYGETVAGAAVIRAFGMQSVFVQSKSHEHSRGAKCSCHSPHQDNKHAPIVLCPCFIDRKMEYK